MKIKDWLRDLGLPKKKKTSGRYQKNREHIRQVKRRKQREAFERTKYRILRKKRLVAMIVSIMVLILLISGGIGIVRAMGKKRLYEKAEK